ncbi:hypothetical protein P278_14830 [Zhouia amylolytica AD3]|uniref:Uncharacterized protein n=1 Tax=Zhouia amylolytica AD3 TaxID=1286632 RepID=W2UQM3_9FLAO|nr:hypothetical protein P278_14830 [Zhouia amylolytica AD3]
MINLVDNLAHSGGVSFFIYPFSRYFLTDRINFGLFPFYR